jgi:hypothetical protein
MLKDVIEKRISIIQKDSKQQPAIKRMGIKNKIQNKFCFLLKGEIEKKNQFNKRT